MEEKKSYSLSDKVVLVAAVSTVAIGFSALLFLIWWVSTFPKKIPPCPPGKDRSPWGGPCRKVKKTVKKLDKSEKNRGDKKSYPASLPASRVGIARGAVLNEAETSTQNIKELYVSNREITVLYQNGERKTFQLEKFIPWAKEWTKKNKRELKLKIKVDAKAKFVTRLKGELLKNKIPFISTEEY